MKKIVADPKGGMMLVGDDGLECPLADWDHMGRAGFSPELDWGSASKAAYGTSYAILRAFYNRPVAEKLCRPFCDAYLSKKPAGRGFTLSQKEADLIVARLFDEAGDDGQRPLR